jgi:hypothetical protein
MSLSYILGAGASYGSQLPNPNLRPPLVKDMFRRSQDISGSGTFGRVSSWCKKRYGITPESLVLGDPDFESVLGRYDSDWDATDNEASLENISLGLERQDLLELVYEVFIGSTIATLRATCPHHDRLAQSLTPGDVILNFNYDFLMEASLEKAGKLSDHGIGAELMAFTHEWTGGGLKPLNGFQATRDDPPHLKLHGSLGWFKRTAFSEMRIDSESSGSKPEPNAVKCRIVAHRSRCVKPPLKTYTSLTVAPKTFVGVESVIVPPAPVKSGLAGPEWKGLWDFALERLSESTSWVSIGYAFRETDRDANELFREAGAPLGDTLDIRVVAPSDGPAIVGRVKKLLPKAKVRNSHPTLEEFARELV